MLLKQIQRREQELQNLMQYKLFAARQYFDSVMQRESLKNSKIYLEEKRRRLSEHQAFLQNDMTHRLNSCREQLAARSEQLSLLNPWNQLQRGWSLTENADGQRLSSVTQTAPGQMLITTLSDGRIVSRVESVKPNKNSTKGAK